MILTIGTVQSYIDTAGFQDIHDTQSGKVSPYFSQRVGMLTPMFNTRIPPIPLLPLPSPYARLRLNRTSMDVLLARIGLDPYGMFIPSAINHHLLELIKTANANHRMPPWKIAAFPSEYPASFEEWECRDWIKACLIWLEDWLTFALRQSFETYICVDAREFYPSSPLEFDSF